MIMTHRCCPPCRLRFTAVGAANLALCPACGQRLGSLVGAERLVGFRLFDPEEALPELPQLSELPEALAVSLATFDPGEPYP